ncbi:MAG: hypothetical protein BWY09_01757 [Candidatus Hydrogenedentes bacterium ADurb.Bin179]|nr:MAG: hypothetical protein BWY09_01757 [Candidatus Hydrogenedentes bacterium ADurb.Bin179]
MSIASLKVTTTPLSVTASADCSAGETVSSNVAGESPLPVIATALYCMDQKTMKARNTFFFSANVFLLIARASMIMCSIFDAGAKKPQEIRYVSD